MSMTDEGAMSSNQSSAKQSPDKNASQGAGAGQSGGNLPGLAAFGQMQGYTPVGHQSGQPSADSDTPQAPEAQAVPQDIDENASDETYAEQFAEEFVREFNQSPETAPEPQPEGPDHAEGFSSEEIQNYMTQQSAAPEPQD